VRVLVEDGPHYVRELVDWGAAFDRDAGGRIALGREAAHSVRRVLHAGDATGREIGRALWNRVTALASVTTYNHAFVVDVIVEDGAAVGVRYFDREGAAREVRAHSVLLATGGAGQVYRETTNPPVATGDGIALASRAGARLADLEFVQFHPTALAGSSLLLSEALRGAGALLVDDEGHRFTNELAPRDVVARAIGSRGTALLDLRPIDRSRFPTLMTRLAEAGYRPEDEPLPVSPAAHYTMGGIVTGLDGMTEVPGLYAAGECACTGVHGANRLASNSMLECLVFGRRAALAAVAEPAVPRRLEPAPRPVTGPPVTAELREAMWSDAGLVRDAPGLERLTRRLHPVVRMVARSALARRESRGAQFRVDFPREDPALNGLHTVLRPGREPSFESWS
jgi:L-aspartate oxidase